MVIGVPREIHHQEHRVGLTPFGAARLTQHGHSVLVESRAGDAAHFTDRDYTKSGAHVVYDPQEVYGRADVVCRVGRVAASELPLLKPRSVLFGFQHLAVAPREHVERLMELETTLLGYEMIRDKGGDLPVLVPFSEMGGRMAIHLAASYLRVEAGGRGVLLANIPGVPPPTVLVLGAGTVGRAAARQAVATGAHVIVLDSDLRKLGGLARELGPQVVTVLGADERLEQYTAIADVLVGGVHIPGERAPYLVTEAMVRAMKPGSVIVDVAIDQGGCVETSRPTTLDQPTFLAHGVVHYCVPNMTASVPRTASRALTNAALPYVVGLAGGVEQALRADPGLAEGVLLHRGRMVSDHVGRTLGIPAQPLARSLAQIDEDAQR
jgi:alanine dehydrogenase